MPKRTDLDGPAYTELSMAENGIMLSKLERIVAGRGRGCQIICNLHSNLTQHNTDLALQLCFQTCLGSIADWMTSNLLCFNSSKTEFLLLGLKPQLDKIQSPALCLSFSILFLSQLRSSTHSPCSRFHYCSVYWHIFCSFQA